MNQLVYAELARQGWEVHLVMPARWRHDYAAGDFRPPPPLPALANSCHVLPVALPGRPQRHFYLANPLRIIRQTCPDILFLEQEPFSLAAFQWGLAAHALNIPFGVQIDENLDRSLPVPVRAARSWVLHNAAYVAARSPAAARLVELWGAPGEVRLVPHHVPGWEKRKRLPSERFRVGFAGRLVPEKGLDVLVDALRRVGGPLELVVAGDGPLRDWLGLQQLGGANLRLVTGLGHDRMDEAYAQMDVLVLPSRTTARWSEQFGRVLVEALSCGVPVVGSDTGEIPWVIEVTGGGRVFPDGNTLALARILEYLRNDETVRQRYAARGEARARELFSVNAVASELGPMLERASRVGARRTRSEGQVPRPQVLLVAHGVHDGGGMERACAELIRHAHREIRFIAVTAELAPELEQLVERWVRIRVPRRPIPLKFVVFFVLAGFAVRRERGDVVHTVGALIPNRSDVAGVHFCHAGARQLLGLAPSGVNVVRQANTVLARSMGLSAECWCYRKDRVRVLAPVSAGVAMELGSHYPNIPLVIVPNGVDTDRFKPDETARVQRRRSEGVHEGEVVALFVGGDWARKGLGIAVEATARARASGASVSLWVVGSGDEGHFKKMAAVAGAAEWVRFFGHQPETAGFYQAADVFVLPSRYETFSLVSYEAAACGVPIVATAVSGVTELIGADEGGIVVSRDPSAVGAALAYLAQNAAVRERLGTEARRRATTYTWDNSAATMLDLYQSLHASLMPTSGVS